ncbi:MAG: BTAD domain-containing putative transcriptional regulator [Trueperaceae bacterium]|nr:BTAD domain-containing putative transcriptional regulator [Trueperaceae bacterium]
MGPYVVLLGTPSIERHGKRIELPPGKLSALLLYLAYGTGWASRDEVLYLLYPDMDERRARGNLRPLLTRLRRLPYAEGLEIEPTRLRWEVHTDVAAFREALRLDAPAHAVELYGGELLAGFHLPNAPEYESWLTFERTDLREAWRRASLDVAARLEEDGRAEEAAGVLDRLQKDDPLDEEVVRRSLTALARADRPNDAVRAYGAFELRLRREVDGEPEEATRAIVQEIRSGGTPGGPAAARAAPRRPPAVLPTPPTEFIGREREVAEISGRLRDPACRLLSIVAAGGMGKTRVAAEVARRLADDHHDGVFFVALEAARSAGQAVTAVADAMALAFFGPRTPLDQLLDHLADKRLLLVLDNFEHLLDDPEGTELVTGLLARAPGASVLTTSRERLNLRAEWVHDLDPMELPGNEDAQRDADAVVLFLQSALRAGVDAEPDLPDVVRVCRLTGGMPLALELAASWLRALTVAEIAEELGGGIGLLASPLRDLPERHHSLRGMFDASWRRLSERERGALRRLATFHGGFRREAAQAVADVSLPLLLTLANRSFLRRDGTGRFTQHPLMWQYLRDAALEDEATRDTAARHAAYYAAFLHEREAGLRGLEARRVRDEIGSELPNVRAAWAWAIAAEREDLLDLAAEGLYIYCNDEGRYHESEALFAAGVDAVGAAGRVAGRLRLFLGGAHNFLARPDLVIPGLEKASAVLATAGAKRDEAMAQILLWSGYWMADRPFETSASAARRALRLFAEAGDRAGEAEVIGLLAEYTEDPVAAEEEFRASLRGFEASGACFAVLGGVSLTLSNYALFLGQVHGAYGRAHALLDEAVRVARLRAEPYSVAWYLNNQAHTLIEAGSWDEAARRLLEARTAAEGLASGWGTWTLVDALYGSGRIALLRGEHADARRHLTRAQERIATHGDPLGTGGQIRVALADLALAEGRPDEAEEQGEEALRHFLTLGLQSGIREWGKADCLVRLGSVGLAQKHASAAAERFDAALAIVERWHLLPLALQLAVAVAPFLRAADRATEHERLLHLAAACPASTRETREAAARALGRPTVAAGPDEPTLLGPLIAELREVVRAMRR